MKLIPVTYYGFTAMDRRFSSPMLPWIVSEIRKRDYSEQLSVGVEDGILQAYNQDFELQFSHKLWQVTRFSQADQDPTTFLYLMRDDHDTQLFCYLFQAKKNTDVLHTIDSVLSPKIKKLLPNATALDFLRFSHYWDHPYKTKSFLQRVALYNLESLYGERGHTYFIPIDKNGNDDKFQQIDSYIIEGHVVPNLVLFTRTAKQDFIYDTSCNGDYVYIVNSFTRKRNKDYIKSYTVIGDSKHRTGGIYAEILLANIPVGNGVVHLISRPLGVFDRELKLFPDLSVHYKIVSDPFLNITYEIGEKCGLNRVLTERNATFVYFVPENRAWKQFQNNGKNLGRILGRHLALSSAKLSMDDLSVMTSKNNDVTMTTLSGPIRIKIIKIDGIFFLYWKGKVIRVLRPDYVCNDGIVHVIDGVLDDGSDVATSNNTPNDISFWTLLKDVAMEL